MNPWQDFILKNIQFGISAHNSQPFRLSFPSGEKIFVHIDPKRLLPVADPHHKDLLMSLGALIETLAWLLPEQQKMLGQIQIHSDFLDTQHLAAEITVESAGANQKSKFPVLENRFSYRGTFDKTSEKFDLVTTNLILKTSPTLQKEIAQLYDEVNYGFIKKPGYLEELYAWLRFSEQHPHWKKDGLNSEAMALGKLESFFGSKIMKPSVFNFFDSIGLGKTLLSEAPKIKSAHGLALIYGAPEMDYIQQGRIFLREWLRLTEMGLYGAPLSLLTDDAGAKEKVLNAFSLPANTTFINLLRVGSLPKRFKHYPRARLAPSEVLHV